MNCGATVPDEANFCNKCGRSVTTVTTQTQTVIHETLAVPQSRHSSKVLVATILLLLVGGIGAGVYLIRDNQLVSQIVASFTAVNPLDQQVNVTDSDAMLVGDYRIRYKPVTDAIPNTVRVQFYGPSKLKGYDLEGNLVVKNTFLRPCKMEGQPGVKCPDNTELRIDLIEQGGDIRNEPLVTQSLAPIQREFTDFVRSGNNGSFLSSVVSLKLPTAPAQDQYTKMDGYKTYIAEVYYDVNHNGRFDESEDWSVGFGDSYITYVWDTSKIKSSVAGWNYESTVTGSDSAKIAGFKDDAALLEKYRRSFESTIMQMPILDSDTQFPLLSEPLPKLPPPTPTTPAQASEDMKQGMDNQRMSFVQDLANDLGDYYSANGSYPPTLAEGAKQNKGIALQLDMINELHRPNEASYIHILYAATGPSCQGFHIGTALETEYSISYVNKYAHDADAAPREACPGSAPDFSGADPIFDLTEKSY